MNKEFHVGNRRRLYANLAPGELAVVCGGGGVREAADAVDSFQSDRSLLFS